MDTLAALKKITIPVLDIYGSKDLDYILESAADRKTAASGNRKYTQKVIQEANHFFVNKNDELVDSVSTNVVQSDCVRIFLSTPVSNSVA